MSKRSTRKRRRERARSAKREGAAFAARSFEETEAAVRDLLSSGSTREALAAAKTAHKTVDSSRSRGLLLDAYAARARALFSEGLPDEGLALLDVVKSRFPEASALRAEFRSEAELASGEFGGVLRRLADPATAHEAAAAIRRWTTDLTRLSESEALPREHELRRGAAQLREAFAAVTSGPVPLETVALPAVSRRSPLAPWKALVEALACFYRRDDAACERWLSAVAGDSPPARAVPVLRALIAEAGGAALSPAQKSLAAAVRGCAEPLRAALERLDDAIRSGGARGIMRELVAAVRECRRHRPDLLDELHARCACKSGRVALDPDEIERAFGGPAEGTPVAFRLLARHNERDAPLACEYWDRFRRAAIGAKWFSPMSLEHAAVCRHMASIAARMTRAELESAEEEARYGRRRGGLRRKKGVEAAEEISYLSPMALYRRACAIDPDPATYEAWHAWARGHDRSWKRADEVAQGWRKACPADSRPVLHLMESAEKRRALKKALRYLEEAARLDALNPEVRSARFRLLVASTVRHLKGRATHLVEKDLERIASLDAAGEGRRPALVAALQWACVALKGDDREGARLADAISRELGSEWASYLVRNSVCGACTMPLPGGSLRPEDAPSGEIARAVAVASQAIAGLNHPLLLPGKWRERLRNDVSDARAVLSGVELLTVGVQAVQIGLLRIAYAVSARGLREHRGESARFLLIRAQSFPPGVTVRREECLAAAFTLAHRQGDAALSARVADAAREWGGSAASSGRRLNELLGAEELEGILRREREGGLLFNEDWCTCPECRRRRGEAVDDDDDDDDEQDIFDERYFDDATVMLQLQEGMEELQRLKGKSAAEIMMSVPPQLFMVVLEMSARYGDAIPPPNVLRREDPDLFRRLLSGIEAFAESRGRRRGRRRRKKNAAGRAPNRRNPAGPGYYVEDLPQAGDS